MPALRSPSSILRPLSSGLCLLLLSGCTTVGPDFEKPAIASPAVFKHAPSPAAGSTNTSGNWWLLYADPTLNRLVETALTYNQQLALAAARLDEVRARYGFIRADRLPTVSTTTAVQLAGESAERSLPTPGGGTVYRIRGDNYRVPLDAAWELDLWGRVRRSTESADAAIEASQQDLAFAQLSVAAEVASTYFIARALNAELAVLDRHIELRSDQTALQRTRANAGLANELDLSRARGELAAAEAERAEVSRRREQALDALSVLTGTTPAEFAFGNNPHTTTIVGAALPTIPAGLPSSLLQRRPDVLAAEATLHARTADIGVARAAFFPNIRLTGSAGFETAELGDLLERPSQFWGIGPSIYFPIFDGGRNRATFAAAEARARGALADYRQKVLIAFREVEDALVDSRQQAEQAQTQARALAAAHDVIALAESRYRQGLISYLEVIDAQRSALGAERALAQLDGARRTSTVRLVRALGGDWQP